MSDSQLLNFPGGPVFVGNRHIEEQLAKRLDAGDELRLERIGGKWLCSYKRLGASTTYA